MIITHKNTATLGDFMNIIPRISRLHDMGEYIHLSLPHVYNKFNGLMELLIYQDFIDEVDFLDQPGDLDIQAHNIFGRPIPTRCNYSSCDINNDVIINIPYMEVPNDILSKDIVIDRSVNNIMFRNNLFSGSNYYWLDYSETIIHNLNICRQTNGTIYSTFTGLPIILNLANIPQVLIYFNDIDGEEAYKQHYFPNRGTELRNAKHI